MSTIIWLLLGYFIFRSVRNAIDTARQPAGFNAQFNQAQQQAQFRGFNSQAPQEKPKEASSKWKLDQSDIEDAEWEELD